LKFAAAAVSPSTGTWMGTGRLARFMLGLKMKSNNPEASSDVVTPCLHRQFTECHYCSLHVGHQTLNTQFVIYTTPCVVLLPSETTFGRATSISCWQFTPTSGLTRPVDTEVPALLGSPC
jgi:hypothetical protein